MDEDIGDGGVEGGGVEGGGGGHNVYMTCGGRVGSGPGRAGLWCALSHLSVVP